MLVLISIFPKKRILDFYQISIEEYHLKFYMEETLGFPHRRFYIEDTFGFLLQNRFLEV